MDARMQAVRPPPDIPSLEKQQVDEGIFLEVLRDVVSTMEGLEVPYLCIGGVASAILGRARWTLDVDVFVRAEDSSRVLSAFGERGFGTQETDPNWLFKAMKDDVYIDIIFQSSGGIFLDDEMLEHGRRGRFRDVELPIAAPEDIIVMKALAHKETTSRYWHDSLSILAHCELDWEYLVRRARLGPRRVLSLLLYALSDDLVVPMKPLHQLFDAIAETPA